MTLVSQKEFDGYEKVLFIEEPHVGLKAIIAIHSTNRGPALGGCRMWNYHSDEEALNDVLRLSRGMTYKAAMANLNLGGGKAVIFGDSKTQKNEALLLAFAKYVDQLEGKYITAEDVGMSVHDMEVIRQGTSHVVGLGSGTMKGGSGDPSRLTAYGVYRGMCAAVHHRLGKDSLEGLTVAIQGLGHVGQLLCGHLKQGGAHLIVTDIDQEAVNQAVSNFGARAVLPEEIFSVEADVFSPCALGGILNDTTIPQLKVSVIAGAANNQLGESRHGEVLMNRNILYAPDYVVNAGGLINVTYEGKEYNEEKVYSHVAKIYDTLLEVYQLAESQGVPPNVAADRIAEMRFNT